MRRRVVAVLGARNPSSEERTLAFRMGELIAREGLALLTGGMGGIMEEASRGAREAGGTVVGVIPRADPEQCNLHVEISIASGMGDARNAIIANSADVFVAVGGAFGTLSEIAFALKRGKTVVGLSTWKLDTARIGDASWVEASTPDEAIEVIRERLKAG